MTQPGFDLTIYRTRGEHSNYYTTDEVNSRKDMKCVILRGYGVLRHFQQYFSYIMAARFIGGGKHRPVASHWHILLHKVI